MLNLRSAGVLLGCGWAAWSGPTTDGMPPGSKGFTVGVVHAAEADRPEPAPKVLDERLQLSVFAEDPAVVTPTGLDVDAAGRVWLLESNTHFPPDGYERHPSDRLWVLTDRDGDGRAEPPQLFVDGLTHAMSVAVEPDWLNPPSMPAQSAESNAPAAGSNATKSAQTKPVVAYVATRQQIVRCVDTNGDLQADERKTLVRLDTTGNYPHNGLAGFAWDPLGWLYFGFGENLGVDYQIIGSDGTTLSGGGEGGNVYRCRPDGSQLTQWATGFWNPHASAFDAFGRLFTVDNDPDSRPPCRLLHIVPGGDYGYRFRNGRKGTHPFTAWNGELPGTLPMVSGTGEAPSGIVCYEHDQFPSDYRGTLLIGSWGDYRIDQFVLQPRGASFQSVAKPIVQGGETFRPVGLAVGPDGAVYFTDWVLRDYKLHGRGRVWKLSAKTSASKLVARPADLPQQLDSAALPVRRRAARQLAMTPFGRQQLESVVRDVARSPTARVEAVWALTLDTPSMPQQLLETREGKPSSVLLQLDDVTEAALRLDAQAGHLWANAVINWDRDAESQLAPSGFDPEGPGWTGVKLRCLAEWLAVWKYEEALSSVAVLGVLNSARPDPFLEHAAAQQLNRIMGGLPRDEWLTAWSRPDADRQRGLLTHLVLEARRRWPNDSGLAKAALASNHLDVQRAAVQWIGEARMTELRAQVEQLLQQSDLSPPLFVAVLATLALLDGQSAGDFENAPPTQLALPFLRDPETSPQLKASALQLIPATAPEPTIDERLVWARSPEPRLQSEAIRSLAQSQRAAAVPGLLAIATDEAVPLPLRAEAMIGLCATPHELPLPADVEATLLGWAKQANHPLQREALRGLRGRATPDSTVRRELQTLLESTAAGSELQAQVRLAMGETLPPVETEAALRDHGTDNDAAGDAAAGQRLFFHHQGPLCFRCHQVQGRGGVVGPDLSTIARTMSREKLWQSIAAPSQEISPQYVTWVVATTAGKVLTGIMIRENGAGDLELGTNQGEVLRIPRAEIEERAPSTVSVMPDGLHKQLTAQEARDLLAYLSTLR
jgi:putative membrane-bound dehydrogenase-like protein